MRELRLASISVSVAVLTAALGYFFSASPWTIVQVILLEHILLLVIKIYLRQQDEDSAVLTSIDALESSPRVLELTIALLHSVARSTRHPHVFFSERVVEFLSDARQTLDSLNAGVFPIDLRPGGFMFREAEAAQMAKISFCATSYVSPDSYWRGSMGARLLAKSRKKIADNVRVTRIFLEHGAQLDPLYDIVVANKAAGVTTKVVRVDSLDSLLRRDFAICDGGLLAVELILNDRREPVTAVYYSSDTEAGRKKITELMAAWEQLNDLAEDC